MGSAFGVRLASVQLCSEPHRIQEQNAGMLGSQLDSEEQRDELVNLHTTEQIEERFRRVFKREMTREERYAFFMPDDDWTKSQG
jgi:PleD family two-component response regulator